MNPMMIGYVAYKIWQWYKDKGGDKTPPETEDSPITDPDSPTTGGLGEAIIELAETLI